MEGSREYKVVSFTDVGSLKLVGGCIPSSPFPLVCSKGPHVEGTLRFSRDSTASTIKCFCEAMYTS